MHLQKNRVTATFHLLFYFTMLLAHEKRKDSFACCFCGSSMPVYLHVLGNPVLCLPPIFVACECHCWPAAAQGCSCCLSFSSALPTPFRGRLATQQLLEQRSASAALQGALLDSSAQKHAACAILAHLRLQTRPVHALNVLLGSSKMRLGLHTARCGCSLPLLMQCCAL